MAYSRTFVFLGLVFAVILLVSFQVSAHDRAEMAQPRAMEISKMEEANNGDQFSAGGYGRGLWGMGKPGGHKEFGMRDRGMTSRGRQPGF